MQHRHLIKAAVVALALSGVGAAAPVALAADATVGAARATGAPRVGVRVEGLNRTLLASTQVQTNRGTTTRAGHPVVGTSALGALGDATRGRWAATWSTEYSEWELTGVLGESHPFSSKYFWAFYVNHVQASVGVGELKLKAGDQLVFAALPDSDYDEPLLGAVAPSSAKAHRSFTVKVVDYNAKGKAVPLTGATVRYNGHAVKVHGASVTITPTRKGALTITISKVGYVRTETTVTVTA